MGGAVRDASSGVERLAGGFSLNRRNLDYLFTDFCERLRVEYIKGQTPASLKKKADLVSRN
jgi:hypothetical protein